MSEKCFTLTYALAEDDWLHYIAYHNRSDLDLRIRTWFGYVVVPIGVAVPVVIRGSIIHGVLVGLGVAIAVALFRHVAFRWQVRAHLRRNPADAQPTTLEITPRGISSASDEAEGTIFWKAIRRIDAARAHIYIYFEPHAAFVIPRRAFASAEEADVFLQTIRSWQAAART
jgi:YcxB-like protein